MLARAYSLSVLKCAIVFFIFFTLKKENSSAKEQETAMINTYRPTTFSASCILLAKESSHEPKTRGEFKDLVESEIQGSLGQLVLPTERHGHLLVPTYQ